MKHSINEIFCIYNSANSKRVLATRRYIETNGVLVATRPHESKGLLVWARPLGYHVNSGKPLKVRDLEGIKLAWLYGEKTWFDTEEELSAHRITVAAEMAENRIRSLAKKGLAEMIDEMSVEEVKAFMEKMGLW